MKKIIGILSAVALLFSAPPAFSQSAPFNAYSVSTLGGNCTSQGSVMVQSANGVSKCLGAGANGQVLQSKGPGADPAWLTTSGTGTVTSVGATVPSYMSVTNSPVTAAGTLGFSFNSGTANQFFATPNGSSGAPGFRFLTGADLPAPGASSLGGVFSSSAPANQFANGISLGGVVQYRSIVDADLPSTLNNKTLNSPILQNGIYGYITNPTVCGWGVSFNNPNLCTGYNNSISNTVYLDSSATNPTNGALFNLIAHNGYNQAIGGVSSTPVAVNVNAELQVDATQNGNDYWSLLGILDVQNASASNVGGQATSGIVRGNWTGTCLCDGVNSVAENYSGRANVGYMVDASMKDGSNNPFDNSFSIGAFVHKAKNSGFQVGGLLGSENSVLPSVPFAFYNANQSASLWTISNNGGASAIETLTGESIVKAPSGGFGTFQMQNDNAVTDNKKWQIIGGSDGSLTIRTLNDAENTANNAMVFTRSGATVGPISISAIVNTSQAINSTSSINTTTTISAGGQINGGSFASGSNVGVSCSGAPTASFAVANGIVTHC